jgi:glutamate 5-kinase
VQHAQVPAIRPTNPYARRLRQEATDAEQKLWLEVRNRRLGGFKFRRQATIGPYVVDFLCPEHALIVEVDGSQHNPEADAERSAFLEDLGYRVVRFWNNEVLQNLEGVLQSLLAVLAQAAAEPESPSPNPLPQAGEGYYGSAVPLFPPASCPRLIVKIGSALLVDPDGGVRRAWLDGIAADIADRTRAGQQVAVVSSGAIALGARRLKLAKGGRASLEDAQAAAATGQIELSKVWAETLGAKGLIAAQMLVTLDDLEDRRRYLNASATLDRLLNLGVVPILNENDSVATEEIRFGDNDRLAARVAQAAGAQGVVLLSDVDGLYDRNPALPDAAHIARVERIDARVEAMADRGSASGMGSGGMVSKIAAARIANAAGAHLAIASGRVEHPLSAEARHTLFVAEKSAPARKAWLAGGLTAKGTIHVDAGAAAALGQGRSLLAAGAVRIEGSFARGDLVAVAGPDGRPIARGLVEYPSDDAARILGRRNEDHAELLSYAPRSALVHRNHMALL